jgi:hypothetical protein
MREGDLYRVVTDNFVAGLVVKEGQVVRAAPILRWAIGKPVDELRRQIEQSGGTVAAVGPGPPK